MFHNGPVHINVPFDEPLYETVDALSISPEVIEVTTKSNDVDDYIIDDCLNYWNSATKKMILVGVNAPNTIEQKHG